MKTSHLKKFACITAIVLAPAVAFAGGTSTQDEASTGQSHDPNPSMKAGDQGMVGVGPTSKQDTVRVDDFTLASKVKSALKNDPMLQNIDIKPEVSKGVVTLTGVISDVRWKARATQVANSVQGVKLVNNRISIGDRDKS